MENLNNDDKLIMKKLLRNEKARIKYNNASIAGCNKKLINKQCPTKRGRKAKQTDILLIDEPKEPTETEKYYEKNKELKKQMYQNKKEELKQKALCHYIEKYNNNEEFKEKRKDYMRQQIGSFWWTRSLASRTPAERHYLYMY